MTGRIIPLQLSGDMVYTSRLGGRKPGFVFPSEKGTMLWPSTIFRDGLSPLLKAMGRSHVRFHAFRRFREATLQRSEVRQILIDYWMGHENGDMSSRYGTQLTEDLAFRQQWAEKLGLGFELPSNSESSVVCATCATNSETETAAA